ncbi:MAG: deoxyuridine 5'-triphosphate nucleotidohydrolase [Methermicoccaceae archaeon]
MLAESELKRLIEKGLVDESFDEKMQLQVNGLELTVRNVERFREAGKLGVKNTERVIPEGETIEFDEDGWIHLDPGAYRIRFNEVVDIPLGIAALAKPRSSLLRCGVALHTAVWDAGYKGRGECLMCVYNPHGFSLQKDARVIHLVFFRLEGDTGDGYKGVYLNENLK